MAAKWQQWMPLNINKIRGSMFFMALPDAAKVGYLFLLMAQWETDDGALPGDPHELATLSGLGERWQEFATRILRKFDPIGEGKIRNQVNYKEWLEAKRVFELRSLGGKRKESIKSPSAVMQESCSSPQAVIQDSSKTLPAVIEQSTTQGQEQEQGQEQKSKKQKHASPPAPPLALPEWVPARAWTAYLQMRVRIRKPMTDYAKQLALNKLEKWRAEGQDVQLILDNATEHNWTGLWPMEERNGQSGKNQTSAQGDGDLAGIETGSSYFDRLFRSTGTGG